MHSKWNIFALAAACVFAGLTGLVAQDEMDDLSLLIAQDMAVDDAVTGQLPEDEDAGVPGSLDDLLAELETPAATDETLVAPAALPAEPIPEKGDDDLADLLGELEDAAPPEALPAEPATIDGTGGLDDLFEGSGDTNAVDDEADPLVDAAAELGLDAEPTPAPAVDGGLDDLLGALEPEAEGPAPDAGGLDDLLGSLDAPPPVAEAPVAEEPVAPDAGGLDDLLGSLDATPPVSEEPVAETPVAPDAGGLDDLLGSLATEEETPEVVEPPPVVVPDPPVVADTVEISDDPVVIDEDALDESILKDLAREAAADMAAGRAPTDSAPPPAPTGMDTDIDSILDSLAVGEEAVIAPEPTEPEPVVPPTEVAPVRSPVPEVVAPAPPVRAPATPVLSADAQRLYALEEVKRRAQFAHGFDSMRAAEEALAKRDYDGAIRLFEQALIYIPADVDDYAAQRDHARRGLAGANYLKALSLERAGQYEQAQVTAKQAVSLGYARAESALRRIQRRLDGPPVVPPATPDTRWEQPAYQDKQAEIRRRLKRGREAYLTGEYNLAIQAFKSVLAIDPYNKEAIKMLHSAGQKTYDRASTEVEAVRKSMMADVRKSWGPRTYDLVAPDVDGEKPKDGTVVTDPVKEQEDRIRRKLERIILPELGFRSANIRDVVDFLGSESRANDNTGIEGGAGVNIILQLGSDKGGAPAAAMDDPFAPVADPMAGGGVSGDPLITFSAMSISLKEAIEIVCSSASLKYKVRGNVLMIVPKDWTDDKIETRLYNVLPNVAGRIGELSSSVIRRPAAGGGGGVFGGAGGQIVGREFDAGDPDWKEFFSSFGVEWPEKSSVKYVAAMGKMVVANTAENLAVFEKVLGYLNVVPFQIEIEARFIEVAQKDLDSLGLEWMLTDNWELMTKPGSGLTPASSQRVQVNQNSASGGFTRGLRNLVTSAPTAASGARDDIVTFQSFLTNPELAVVVHAIQQSGHTDLLSAPKITTQSGQQAELKVVTEYIYPTEFETSGISQNNNTTTGNNQSQTIGAVVTPQNFETREVGVVLNVLPQVSPEGQMINLKLSPQVVSEPEWRNYGSSYTSYDPNGNPITQELNMEQPFFHTRSLETSMLIYNGATVVMGGMITEIRTDVDDRIPILGSIPILGNLFRSRYEHSEKRNLLIFVTARLVDPSGRPLENEVNKWDDDFISTIIGRDGQERQTSMAPTPTP